MVLQESSIVTANEFSAAKLKWLSVANPDLATSSLSILLLNVLASHSVLQN